MPSPLQKISKNTEGLILILGGAFFMLLFFSWRFYQVRVLSFSGNVPQVGEHKGAKPISIEIASIHLKLVVEEAIIKDGVWQVSETGASHLNQSAYPGDRGNIVIYGHNKNSLFGPIRWLEKGAEIKLTDEKGTEHIYKVDETHEVSPDNLQFVLPKNEETLTLYTCTGLFDRERFIVIAKPRSS